MIAVIYLPPPLPVLLPASPILTRPSRSCLRPNPSAHRARHVERCPRVPRAVSGGAISVTYSVPLTPTESPHLLPTRRESPITSTTHTSTFLALLRHRGNSLTIYGYAGRKAPRHSPLYVSRPSLRKQKVPISPPTGGNLPLGVRHLACTGLALGLHWAGLPAAVFPP